jgi:hypothetical protein
MTIQTVDVEGRHYENRLNRCGKPNCTICYPPGGSADGAPGHGPYWYLTVMMKGKFHRFYIGKTLDTRKFVGPDGTVDVNAYRNRKEGDDGKKAEVKR